MEAVSLPRLQASQQTATVRLIGGISLGLGTALTVSPRRTSDVLGLPHSGLWTPVLGAVDATLGLALVSGRHQRRWMHVRATASMALAGLYAAHRRSSPRPSRTGAGMAMMALITVTDSALARALPQEFSN